MGSSILGGASSASTTLAGTAGSLCLGLKKSPTRADRRRPTLGDLGFSSFFSSFCDRNEIRSYSEQAQRQKLTFSSTGAASVAMVSGSAAGASASACSLEIL